MKDLLAEAQIRKYQWNQWPIFSSYKFQNQDAKDFSNLTATDAVVRHLKMAMVKAVAFERENVGPLAVDVCQKVGIQGEMFPAICIRFNFRQQEPR